MASASVQTPPPAIPRTAILASPDLSFRQRVRDTLTGLRWQVREASGGAEAMACLDAAPSEALVLDSWLPDLEINEFVKEFERLYPGVDLVMLDTPASASAARSPRRNELLYALRRGQDADGAIWNSAPVDVAPPQAGIAAPVKRPVLAAGKPDGPAVEEWATQAGVEGRANLQTLSLVGRGQAAQRLPEFIGENAQMLEVSRRIRLVAPRRTPVLVQGPTGTGKELVAKAVHRLSTRAARPFVVLNCAAIPEALLEAELFGHTRGAFTGAVQGRVGRIEAANGGTLFLDEIGEMPLPLQAKLLRFVECGELQRIGENEPVTVDVRIVAATHQPLAELAGRGSFRSDLYYRLSVFMIRTPSLAMHMEDLPGLAEHFLARLGKEFAAKKLAGSAMRRLEAHRWPGNVRELEHVLERACILAEDRAEIGEEEIEFGEDAG